MPYIFFFFNDTSTSEIYTLSLHDALPIFQLVSIVRVHDRSGAIDLNFSLGKVELNELAATDRKSTRLNSSHRCISYAVFCLKKKNEHNTHRTTNFKRK